MTVTICGRIFACSIGDEQSLQNTGESGSIPLANGSSETFDDGSAGT
jgi:hypothetical protein